MASQHNQFDVFFGAIIDDGFIGRAVENLGDHPHPEALALVGQGLERRETLFSRLIEHAVVEAAFDRDIERGHGMNLAAKGQRLGVRVVTEILDGSPDETIIGYSAKKNIELIVLGSHGRTALADVPMGGVVERVISLSPRPTLVVKKG